MKALEEKITREGTVLSADILKVGNFLNQQLDVPFLMEMGREIARLYEGEGVTKILTIEASGIGIACLTAQFFHCPILFAKKTKSRNISSDLWVSTVHSYTHGTDHEVVVARQYLTDKDKVLIIDDFLANGSAITALVELCESAGAEVVGAAVAIEKAYQSGGAKLRAGGLRLEALARVAHMGDDGSIEFCD